MNRPDTPSIAAYKRGMMRRQRRQRVRDQILQRRFRSRQGLQQDLAASPGGARWLGSRKNVGAQHAHNHVRARPEQNSGVFSNVTTLVDLFR